MRELEERLATVPDFFVEDVRLEAAAARFAAGLAALRDFEAVLRAEDFAAPRLALRDAVFFAPERAEVREPPRAEVERAGDFFAADLVVDFVAVFLAEVFLAGVFLAEVFFAAERLVDDFAAVFLAPDFAGDFFAAVLAVDFAAVFLAPVLAGDFFAAVLAVDFAAVLEPAFLAEVLFEPAFDALERDEAPVDFAALLRAVEEPDFAEDLVPFAALVELRRALLFFVVFLVLVAPVSPVNSIVNGFDLLSVGIAASFKGLRVQPSRFEGNVVIPSGFRLTESVDSRTGTFSVDTSTDESLCTCSLMLDAGGARRQKESLLQSLGCSPQRGRGAWSGMKNPFG